MVEKCADGDEIFFHFSGHGTQVPTSDPAEADGKDEAICPCDMNVITDNDLRAIFSPLKAKPKVKLTFVAGVLLRSRGEIQVLVTGHSTPVARMVLP